MQSAIDVNALQRATGNDPDIISEIVEDFVTYTQSGISLVRTAVTQQDAEELGITIHRLKGSANLVGAYGLLDTLKQVEAAADATDWPTARRLVPELHALMKHIEEAASALIDSRSTIRR
jgi:HPt (histidine-containing phosphotransfer) domain-containing protein